MTLETKEKLTAISKMILHYSEQLNEFKDEEMIDSPIIDSIIIACLKYKHASGVKPQEALSIIQKILK